MLGKTIARPSVKGNRNLNMPRITQAAALKAIAERNAEEEAMQEALNQIKNKPVMKKKHYRVPFSNDDLRVKLVAELRGHPEFHVLRRS
jgi:hypothetical protein